MSKRKNTDKIQREHEGQNIPMADLSCSSPLPSADQVEIYVPLIQLPAPLGATQVVHVPSSLQHTKSPC